ncbi:actin-binding protein anillin-like isoform X4 [Sinocyclocheilus anshuiensis]|uniref:actin-binding protein anillin-like isoform X4 n=1 Tax=Sinocyclocheilus anshuiensis TaxID=1608454 RepID=UPI0007BA661D|nr:PREDICTED: actin-binding protein anillin-like isoform X4 [Sinocyclocheilus anshuiensis]
MSKLLERTRARRENLQRKMAERPTAANRPMAKRTREPLTDTNSVISEPTIEKALPSSKPSPSKRRCSDENALLSEEENKQPAAPHVTASEHMTDKKPPLVPSSARPMPLEQRSAHCTPEPEVLPTRPPSDTEKLMHPPQSPAKSTDKHAALDGAKEAQKDAPTPGISSMRSRLQRLAEQRQYWDSEGTSETIPESVVLSPLKSHKVDLPPATPTNSELPVGRKGRLANLAATIGSWEDALGHPPPPRDNAQPQPGTACVCPPVSTVTSNSSKPSPAVERPQTAQPAQHKSVDSGQQPTVYSPVKSTRVVPPSPQKTEFPQSRLAQADPSPVSSPLKIYSSTQPSSPLKSLKASPSSPHRGYVSQSPLKNQGPSKLNSGAALNSSPAKPILTPKPSSTADVTKGTSHTTLIQHRDLAGTTVGVKSFLERFGERCQERNQNSPSALGGQGHTPVATPSATPKSRLLQERLGCAQATSTTAVLTQKQKMEREAELAQIRNRFQKGNMLRSKEDLSKVKNDPENKEIEVPVQSQTSVPVHDNEPSTPVPEVLDSPSKYSEKEKECALPSPAKEVEFKEEIPIVKEQEEVKEVDEVHEIEMNVDGSVNYEVINELFDGVLEESEEKSDEDAEEDALNISSMSLLAPLAETVAAVVKSPERKPMVSPENTSTPASSFIEKSSTPESVSRPSKFQRTRMLRAGSSDSISVIDEQQNQNLLYSIDAYRSTRVKTESERPHVKQVIVRKEDVSQRMETNGSPSHINIKQKMKMLTNEMNLQQTVIHQASQALNCCTDEEHGKGSQVEAEAERLLLIATERRAALKVDLDQLKAEGPTAQKKSTSSAQVDMGLPASKGSISLLELRLPLKADFICSSANKPECGNHYFFVMIRAGAENTVATPLASTRTGLSGDAFTFSTKFTLSDVSNDFEIDIEVYCFVQKRELNPDKRKKPNKSKSSNQCVQILLRHFHDMEAFLLAITPKRFLAISKSNLQTPVVASPGGPNAVRTSSFVLVGSHKLTLASIGKNKFLLEKIKYEGVERELLSDMFHKKVPFLCSLEGHIYLKMQCQVGSRIAERGFLTMFEDVSGFGAWHRRWCVLSGYCISFWTYPDDEKRKNPIGRVNLANCTSRKVEPANREFCARPNTFELITVRPQREDDRETLVSQCKDTLCVTKNWLSADTKDERNLWMQKLNQILVDLRMWQPDSCYKPM